MATGREVDIADPVSVRLYMDQNPEISHIVNCAAYSQVDAAEKEREAAYRANAIGPGNLAMIAKERGVKLIHISTDYVFPGNGKTPLTEKDPVGPLSYYGLTKLEGEERALSQSASVIRTSWIFGSGGKNFVSKLFQMMREEESIFLTADQWGRPTYTPDLARALLFSLRDQSGVFHFASQGAATKYLFGCSMRDAALKKGWSLKVKEIHPVPGTYFPSPCKRPPYCVFDTSKVESILGEPIRPWQQGLDEFLCMQSALSTASS